MTSLPSVPDRPEEALFAAASGRLLPIEEVPDEMFAEKMLGDGFAVEPDGGVFRAPVTGELVVLASTLHAFAIRTDSGAEVLVHIGIDTVELAGEGFEAVKRLGDRVEAGDEVVWCELERIAGRVPSMITPVIITNGDQFAVTQPDLHAAPGAPVALVVRRS